MIDRRTFLQWGAAAPLLLGTTFGAAAATVAPQNTLVVVDDINAATDANRLAIVLGAFARNGIPVTCLIDPRSTVSGHLQPESPLSTVLREKSKSLPGLLELAPMVSDLADLNPYFQARATYEAVSGLNRGLWGDRVGADAVPYRGTIACDLTAAPTAPAGVRAGGTRNVIMRPSFTTPVQPEGWQNGVVRMIGGQRTTLDTPPDALRQTATNAVERVLYLSAQDFKIGSLARLEADASAYASAVLRRDGTNLARPILASDIQYRDSYDYERKLGLHFLLSADATEQDSQNIADFRLDLLDLGIPSSFGVENIDDKTSAYWVTLEGNRRADLPFRPVDHFRSQTDLIDIAGELAPLGVYGIATRLVEKTQFGMDQASTLGVPAFVVRDAQDVSQLASDALGAADCVLAISDKVLRNRPQRNMLRQTVAAITDDGISTLKTLPDYVRDIAPYDPYITHFRRTLTSSYRPAPALKDPAALERDRLMEDAKVAWQYFDRWTNAKTGLCPATVNFSDGGRELHEAVTMWDVGSHINALIAAVDLEIISTAAFQRAIRKIIPNIAGRRSQGRLLPQGWIATNKFKWGNKNFDGCDAGRLLAALYNLDIHPKAKDKSAKTVAAWNLKDIVKDGVIYSVESGKLASTFRSHCAHYAAWAFRTWGIEARSPYEVFQNKSDCDGQMALLEVGGHIGPMGAEPLLLEAIELGMSPESAYLADVLFAAQLEEYEQTGKLTCVSEGPIDRAPWFTYQGIQFDAPGRVWATDTVDGLAEHRSEAFRAKNLAISSKAAFLWSAYKDHPYCETLVEFVRERAKTSSGFSSSIYQSTGEPTATYTDINTNAIILQSIAYKLKNANGPNGVQDG